LLEKVRECLEVVMDSPSYLSLSIGGSKLLCRASYPRDFLRTQGACTARLYPLAPDIRAAWSENLAFLKLLYPMSRYHRNIQNCEYSAVVLEALTINGLPNGYKIRGLIEVNCARSS